MVYEYGVPLVMIIGFHLPLCRDLLTDTFIESKVEAAAVIGTLFTGPFDVGSFVLAREGILEGLILLTQCENVAYQVSTVFFDIQF